MISIFFKIYSLLQKSAKFDPELEFLKSVTPDAPHRVPFDRLFLF